MDQATRLFQAAERGDVESVKDLLKRDDIPLWWQEDITGWTVLHAATASENAELVDYLLQKGAIWNAGGRILLGSRTWNLLVPVQVDVCGFTAGDVALSLNNESCYRLIRDAGLRSGMFPL
jgi:protein arginine N-methyltransferase 2